MSETIDPTAAAPVKAAAYVDLLLAHGDNPFPSGEPPALLEEHFGSEACSRLGSGTTIAVASLGLTGIAASGKEGLEAVHTAVAARPELLSILAGWIAYTPWLGEGEAPAGFEPRGIDFKRPELTDALVLTPEQKSVQYSKAVVGATSLLLCVARPGQEAMRTLVREHFVGSRHFRNAMLRLVAHVGRWNPVPQLGSGRKQDESKLAMHLALVARDVLVALAIQHRTCLDLLDEATHPFSSASARSLVEAMPHADRAGRSAPGHGPSPLGVPKIGARHADDPFTLRDYFQTGAALAAVGAVLWFAVWPALIAVLSLPGRVWGMIFRYNAM